MQQKLLKGNCLLFWWLGIFSTMTALSFKGVSIFYLLILLSICKRLFFTRFVLYKCGLSLGLTICVAISLTFNLLGKNYYIEENWSADIAQSSIVFICIVISVTFLYSVSERRVLKNYFLKGLAVSAKIQLIWGGLQALFWYIFDISINEIIFEEILKVNIMVNWTKVSDGLLRISGIGWEPAYFSFAMIAGYILTNARLLKFAFIAGILISSSRTGIIIGVFTVFLEFFLYKKERLHKKFDKNICQIFILFVLFIIFFGIIPEFRNAVFENIHSLIHWEKTTSGLSHLGYIILLPQIIKNMSLRNLLFGYGYSASGLPYTILFPQTFQNKLTIWSVENEYINCFIGLGVIGFLLYFILIVKTFLIVKDIRIKLLIGCFLVGGMFYVYSGTWIIFLIFLCYDAGNLKKIKEELLCQKQFRLLFELRMKKEI